MKLGVRMDLLAAHNRCQTDLIIENSSTVPEEIVVVLRTQGYRNQSSQEIEVRNDMVLYFIFLYVNRSHAQKWIFDYISCRFENALRIFQVKALLAFQ